MNTTAAIEKLTGASSDLLAKTEQVRKSVWSFLTMSLTEGVLAPKKSLAVSIERGSLWVVLGSRFLSKIRVRGYRKYSFEEGSYPSPESLASTLELAIKELRASRASISLSMPREWVMVRTAELPSAVKENLAGVIGYELDRLTPFSPEDAYYDFKVLGEAEGKLSVVITAAKADVIDRYLEALRNSNLSVETVTINLSSLGTYCAYMDGSSSFLCLEADFHGYEGALVRENVLSSSFWGSLPEGGVEAKADVIAGAANKLVEEPRQQGLPTPIIVHSSDEALNSALAQRIDSSLRIVRDADTKLKFSTSGPALSGNAAGALLESLWPGAVGLNLLAKGLRKGVKKEVGITIVLILAFLAAWVPYIVLPLDREEKRLEEINRQIALRKDEVKKVEALRKETDALNDETKAIQDFKEKSPMAIIILKELTTILPKDTWLTRTRLTDTTVELEGYAKSASEILPKLEQSKYFKKVEFAQPTIRDPRMEADRFVVKMEIEGFGSTEGEKPKDGKKK